MFGFAVSSDVPLPLPRAIRRVGESAAPAWIVRRRPAAALAAPDGPVVAEERCDCADHRGAVYARVWRGPGGAWLWDDRVGTCHVSSDARAVAVDVRPGADPGAVALLLLGPVAGLVLHRLGYAPLHASAVVYQGRGIAFLAPPGTGKSTLAAAFLRRGATLLSDDVLPLRRAAAGDHLEGLPGVPVMKVWPATATRSLGIAEDLPRLTAALEKRQLDVVGRYPFADAPARLHALYVVRRGAPPAPAATALGGLDGVSLRPLGQQEALTALLAQAYRGEYLLPAEAAGLLACYAALAARVPVRLLRFPSGFELQDAVCDRILEDVPVASGLPGAAGAGGAVGA